MISDSQIPNLKHLLLLLGYNSSGNIQQDSSNQLSLVEETKKFLMEKLKRNLTMHVETE
jgi:hypothetical protein